MADLEEQLLKRNIPGKYSWWEQDDDESGAKARAEWLDPDASDPEQEMSEMDRQRKFVEADVPEPVRRSIMAGEEERQRGAAKVAAAKKTGKTGPKGVLADYRAAKAAEAEQRRFDEAHREAVLRRIAEGPRVPAAPCAETAQQQQQQNEEEELDADFLQKYRAQRLHQLQTSADLPSFGSVREVGRSEFVSEVDRTDSRTFVVVHVYEPYIHACQRMNRQLELLSRRRPEVKFVRLLSSAAASDYDPVALPTLLVYRGGELVSCFTRVTDDIGDNFTQDDVEWLLQEHGVLDAPLAPDMRLAKEALVLEAAIALEEEDDFEDSDT